MLPRVGKIHLGVKVKNAQGREYPKATDHFVVPAPVAAVYGEQPKELSVVLPTADPEIIAPTWYKAYLSSTLACRGDGVTAVRLIYNDEARLLREGLYEGPLAHGRSQPENKKRSASRYTIHCPGQDCPIYQSDDCSELMMLQFLLPDVPGFGVWQIDTGSFHSIRNILDSLAYLQLFGNPAGMRLTLSLEPMTVTRPDGRSNTVYVMHLRYAGMLSNMIGEAQRPGFALPEGVMPEPDESRPDLILPRDGHAPEPDEEAWILDFDERHPFPPGMAQGDMVKRFWAMMRRDGLTEDMLEGVLGMTFRQWAHEYRDAREGLSKAWQMMCDAYLQSEAPAPPDDENPLSWIDDDNSEAGDGRLI